MKTLLLFIATALADIIGCYLPWFWFWFWFWLWLWLKQARSILLLIPASLSLQPATR